MQHLDLFGNVKVEIAPVIFLQRIALRLDAAADEAVLGEGELEKGLR